MYALKIIYSFALFIFVESKSKIGDFVPVCSLSDPKLSECIKTSMFNFLPYAVKGIREWNVVPLDPIFIPRILTGQNHGSINLRWEHINSTFRGFGKLKIADLTFKKDGNDYTFKWNTPTDSFSLVGDYKGEGRMFVLPIKGNGKEDMGAAIKLWETTVHAKEEPEKSGRKYLKIKKVDTKMQFTNARAEISNLFDGNNELSKTINQFINENANELLIELAPALEKAVGEIVKQYVQRIFDNIPVDEMFKP